MALYNMIDKILGDTSTSVVAAAAVLSPAWLPELEKVSEIATLLLPIVGVAWLVIQILYKLYKRGG